MSASAYGSRSGSRPASGTRRTTSQRTRSLSRDDRGVQQPRLVGDDLGCCRVSYKFDERMTLYGSVQSGYQSGQYPARPFCLIGSFNFGTVCSQAELFRGQRQRHGDQLRGGPEGQPLDNLQMSIAVFNTEYSDLPYQVSYDDGRRFQYAEHHRRPDLARRRVGKHLGGDRQLPPLHDPRLHRRRRRRSESGRGCSADTRADGIRESRS